MQNDMWSDDIDERCLNWDIIQDVWHKNRSGCNSAFVSKINRSASSSVNENILWHQRMGNIGVKGLKAMQRKGIVE